MMEGVGTMLGIAIDGVKSSKSGNAVGCFVVQVQRSVKQTFLSCCRLSSCVASCLRQISSCLLLFSVSKPECF